MIQVIQAIQVIQVIQRESTTQTVQFAAMNLKYGMIKMEVCSVQRRMRSHAAKATVSIDCVRKLVGASPDRCGRHCIGFSYTCPICRKSACVTRSHVGALITGSWEKFERQFHNAWVGFDHNQNDTSTDSNEDETSLTDDTSDSSDVVAMV